MRSSMLHLPDVNNAWSYRAGVVFPQPLQMCAGPGVNVKSQELNVSEREAAIPRPSACKGGVASIVVPSAFGAGALEPPER
jgi:hypothetical protein